MFIWRLNIGYWKINFIKRELGSLPQCFLSLLFSFPCLFCSCAVANFTFLTLVSLAWNHAKAHTHLSFPHSISPRRAFSMFTLSFPRTLHLNPPRGSSPWVVFSFPSKNREEDRNPGARRDVMANPREEWVSFLSPVYYVHACLVDYTHFFSYYWLTFLCQSMQAAKTTLLTQ